MGDWLEPTLRFLHYALLLGLFGWTAFRLVGLRGLDSMPGDRGNTFLVGAAITAPMVSVALMLASIAAMMGVSVFALDGPMIEAMVVGTDMGWAFLIRAALLVFGLLAIIARHRSAAALPMAAICFAGSLMTLGWSCHAAATEDWLGLLHRFNNGVHLLAAGLWLGAIGWFLYLTRLAHGETPIVPAQPLLGVMHRFAPLGIALVAAVAVTGLINAQLIFGLENSAAVITTNYGLLLAAKVVLVAVMLGFGAHNALIGRRNLDAEAGRMTDNTALIALHRSLTRELVVGIVIIGLVALLGMLSPTIT